MMAKLTMVNNFKLWSMVILPFAIYSNQTCCITVFPRSIMLHHKLKHAYGPCTKVHLAHSILLKTLSACSNSVITRLGPHQTLKALV
ncbi:hypothetical protein BpHYR1_011557 [Brachionus plicatilis]|uniref:Uncharacterized protein n=1 Tax=Brachionus plicatilis TaxID=10195 RepID=A0A3M7SS17_BRAPC|nr:hypothetical protein BpHYR1_011557 [Brachionus plicatilis]